MGRGTSRNIDWVTIRAEVEAGVPVTTAAVRHGCSTASIYIHRKKEGWTPVTRTMTDGIVAKTNQAATEIDRTVGQAIPKGRSVGQPIGDVGADQDVISKFSAATGLPAPDAKAVLSQAATEIQVMAKHRAVISRASVVAENILVRLHALVVDGVASDVITFKTKAGEAYHRVPFLGDRESVSDALIKCANTISKLIPLERQAHGLIDKNEREELPRVTFNMPNVKVVSVDGHGKVIRTEDRPAPIDVTPDDANSDSKPISH